MTSDQRFLSYREASRYLSIPIGTLRSMVSRKQVPHVRMGSKLVKFELADLDRWLDVRTRSAELVHGPVHSDAHPSSLAHEAAIGRIVPNWERIGFWGAMAERVGIYDQSIIPDAFEFDAEARCLSLFELVHTNDIKPCKLIAIRELHEKLVAVGWSLRLLAASSRSCEASELDVDTGGLAESELELEIKRNHVRFALP
ncbi:MAG TPA: excisionase family DNA-binding protein [Mycobacterium sp.]|nr:excisionase family DNA-binding protein [Mycobacterium sp.]